VTISTRNIKRASEKKIFTSSMILIQQVAIEVNFIN